MPHHVISVRNLSKQYRIGMRGPRYRTLRESLAGAFMAPFRSRKDTGASADFIWALKDVSFDVQRGEVLGLIGRNGAGKSTLLKVLSEITYPTEGRVEIRGRVGSLLEVGTGFHPELTGRENIFLNGAILGMTRAEITRKFDEIVSFAEVEKFIDTPVKRYSSGMYVRLAFAVAAHLEPEILLVDEVLAVGDTQFQKKCMGKMGDVARGEGRTIIFVSHNMAAIEALCERCILLDGGRVAADGPVEQVISAYQAAGAEASGAGIDLSRHPGRRAGSVPLMRRAAVLGEPGAPGAPVHPGSSVAIQVDFESPDKPLRPFLGVSIRTIVGARVMSIDNRIVPGYAFGPVREGRITCRLDRVPFLPGTYVVDLYLGDENVSLDAVLDAVAFEVAPADVFGSGKLPPPGGGPLCWPARWSLNRRDGSEVTPTP